MFERILVPVDFNDVLRRPLEIALELARLAHGKIVLLSVIDDSFPNPDIFSFQVPWADYHRYLRDEAQKRLGRLKSEVGGGDEIEIVVLRGHPARTIAKLADEEKHDLIVMATHGGRGLQHVLVGSVTRRVLQSTDTPVMVVHVHPATERGPVSGLV
jgi:nucleotide-binding universal stress UspA family protein